MCNFDNFCLTGQTTCLPIMAKGPALYPLQRLSLRPALYPLQRLSLRPALYPLQRLSLRPALYPLQRLSLSIKKTINHGLATAF